MTTPRNPDKELKQFVLAMVYQPSESKIYRPISFRWAYSSAELESPARKDWNAEGNRNNSGSSYK